MQVRSNTWDESDEGKLQVCGCVDLYADETDLKRTNKALKVVTAVAATSLDAIVAGGKDGVIRVLKFVTEANNEYPDFTCQFTSLLFAGYQCTILKVVHPYFHLSLYVYFAFIF